MAIDDRQAIRRPSTSCTDSSTVALKGLMGAFSTHGKDQ